MKKSDQTPVPKEESDYDVKPFNHIATFTFVFLAVVLVLLLFFRVIPFWGVLVGFGLALCLATSIRVADQWEKAVVLRMGKFIGLKGPGLFFIIPIFDRIAQYVDQRVRVTAFFAERTLTGDTVPVNVGAVIYWMVWDPEKAALEVRQYERAVSFVAQTGLRDIIGKHELAVRNRIRKYFRDTLQVPAPKFRSHGAFAMDTLVDPLDCVYGIDDGVYLQHLDKQDDSAWPTAAAVQLWLMKAAAGHGCEKPIDKKACVRVRHAGRC